MYSFIRISPMMNGEQDIEKFDTYTEALENANSGDAIYKLVEELK